MISYKDELYHHGIKGQKWGVRRYRNEDGSLTDAGKQRYSSDGSGKKSSITGKKVAVIAGAVGLAAAAAYVSTHPGLVKSISNSPAMKAAMPFAGVKNKAASAAKAVGKAAKEGAVKGTSKGVETIITATVAGSVMLAGKKALDRVLDPDTAGQIMNANNKKKIGSFWNYSQPKDDDDD